MVAGGEALEEAAGGAEGVGLVDEVGDGVGEVGREGLVGGEGGVEGLAEGEESVAELRREARRAVSAGEAVGVGELRSSWRAELAASAGALPGRLEYVFGFA